MADQKLNKSLTRVLERAIEEATARRAPVVEAEHLLLTLASDETLEARRVLTEVGLNHETISDALLHERQESLSAVGIEPVSEELFAATPRQSRPGWGTSTKEAIQRGKAVSGQDGRRRPAETELLLGILTATLGTVPRVLAYAGVDRSALLDRARAA
ncbi:Clp protease N-terminal domain-containing protein [Pseudactinotalea sp.]|uniref:Clp protease N-terminal domain-containing protein n=1 Tax=Pseudactinotalea sp. TaxID=1926260 RepID=UPI003B3B4607